ncbi:hypothetical protein VCV18_002862 [Metarhizium anisopliae]
MASHRTLFGGPAQPTPVDERGGIRAASRKAAESESVCSPNQYQNDDVSFAAPDGCDETLTTWQTELESPCPLDRTADP